MSYKKTVTFTASVSDYTDGTVSARVQAENKILGDFISWILSHNLNLSVQEHIEIGSSQWSGKPFYCSTSGYTGVDSNSTTTDFYVIGKGKAKKCLGFSVDQHRLFFGLTDTVEKDLSYSMSSSTQETYGRIPAVQMRRDNDHNIRNKKIELTDQIWGWNFSQSDNDLILTVSYWKSTDALAVLIDNDGNTSFLVLSKDPSTCFYAFNKELQGLHFSFDDDFLISDATYSFNANNSNYDSNIYLGYAMSYNPFFARQENTSMISTGNYLGEYPTCILCHLVGSPDNQLNTTLALVAKIAQPQNGLATASYMPTQTGFGFPRIANNELYIKKMYVPMTYPAVVSPLKVGYTPGTLRAGTVYKVLDKYYLCLTNGVIGHFIEVADQDA